jgi:xylose isomerase
VGLNPEVGHVLMGHEDLPGAFASVLREGRLAHSHWNSQPLGNYDQDLNAGVLGIDQMLATLLVFKMYNYAGFYGIDINPERMPVEKAIALNINALNSGVEVVNGIDYEALVEAMYDPAGHRGVVEETLTKAWAPKATKLMKIPK